MSAVFAFTALSEPRPWRGRYSRIPGKEPVFHVDAGGRIAVRWYDSAAGEKLCAQIKASAAATRLGASVNEAKCSFSGGAGGSFAINEFGDVICPVGSGDQRYLVGRVKGVPQFVDPRRAGQEFSLRPPDDVAPGTPWSWPYLGMKFNLDTDDLVYFKMEDPTGTRKIYVQRQDPELAKRLRAVRGGGQVIRFIVNLHGAVFTKREPDWQAVAVGFIRPAFWFPDGGES